jgi:hypothetical protein
MSKESQKQQKESYQRNLIRKAIFYLENVTKYGEISLFEGFNKLEIDIFCVALKKFCTKFDLEKILENLVLERKVY